MAKRDTCLKRFGPRSNRLEHLVQWRDHVRDHIGWIDENRASLTVYQAMRKLYLREFLAVSLKIQKNKAARRKRAAAKAA